MLQPLRDLVLVKREEKENTTSDSGIIISTEKEKLPAGTVKAAGPESTLNEGDSILFSKFAGTEITEDGEAYLLMKEEDVLAVVV